MPRRLLILLRCQAIYGHRSSCRCIPPAAYLSKPAVCCCKKIVPTFPLDAGEISSICYAAAVIALLRRCLTTTTDPTIQSMVLSRPNGMRSSFCDHCCCLSIIPMLCTQKVKTCATSPNDDKFAHPFMFGVFGQKFWSMSLQKSAILPWLMLTFYRYGS